MPLIAEERRVDPHGLASVTLGVHWSDDRAVHEDELHVEKFSVWREADILPAGIGSKIPGMAAGDHVDARVAPGDVVGPWRPDRQIGTTPSSFDTHHRRGLEVRPRVGRFYPQGFFHGVRGIFEDAIEPARITGLSDRGLALDLNHPLARFAMRVGLRVDQVLPGFDRRGGRCVSPLDDLLRHTGLAAPLGDGGETDYGDDADGLSRMDPRGDDIFYGTPRMVQHLDDRALQTVNALYRRLIPDRAEVLDLMASFDSHLQGVDVSGLQVLGMNPDELEANPLARNRIVHDLNDAPTLPQEEGSLDAVICTASIEYLTRPRDVLAETRRVLRPGGLFAVTFSNRWFPTKAIRIWSELHEFERVGMVTQWLQQAGFAGLHTFSSRGWPRPADDRHAGETPYSDPVYAVWGFKPDA